MKAPTATLSVLNGLAQPAVEGIVHPNQANPIKCIASPSHGLVTAYRGLF